ncbi:uncharacterized protein TRIADDRAFT_52625 [Trichoplax adhaerens]|uniref:G-protein coupled receptors family 1 profile domain-containing protein n=1 Tax=Trichoplax adhaerens TaxID=10228 RepID=B3RJH3_TRIAD|nr:hypothetical protein TRIADDRAFT_52625 [Trichoplax adhaerens]EDV29096.1 hypothetical protein TRIADDRAFT_52625 [Trichoplax adhaerens]|eukprot:XP_002108298.1 hypothetical protein TRIADDRAFT_52625 [Trichoplax adhaerens]
MALNATMVAAQVNYPTKDPSLVPGVVISYAILGVLIVLTNSSILLIMLLRKQSLVPQNYLMISLFIDDILFACLYIFPRFLNPFWIRDIQYCAILPALGQMIIVNTNLHLCWISVEKYIAIGYPRWHKLHVRRAFTLPAIILTWFISLLFVCYPYFDFRDLGPISCFLGGPRDKEFRFELVLYSFLFFIPLIAMSITYTRIFIVAKRLSSKSFQKHRYSGLAENGRCEDLSINQVYTKQRVKHHYKTAKVLGAMVSVFFIGWFPFVSISIVLRSMDYQVIPQNLYTVVGIIRYIAFSTLIINPILYGYFIAEVRQTIARATKCTHRSTGALQAPRIEPLTVAFRNAINVKNA